MKKLPIFVLLVVPFLGVVYALYQAFTVGVSTTDLALVIVGAVLTEYGVTFGYHRLVVHKAFTAHPALRAVVIALGSMSFQGPVINWASVHTKHHARSDQEGDPHTPTFRGFMFAHLEWLIEMSSDDVAQVRAEYGARYDRDPMLVFFQNSWLFWCIISLVIPAAIGGIANGWYGALTGLVWGGLVRIFLTSHVTWSVNSVCHVAGRRMFRTTDHSRNNWIVGILALGEGWHNNHHAFPSSAFHGLKWYQIDITGLTVRLYERLGLVTKVVRIPKPYLERRLREDAPNVMTVAPIVTPAVPTASRASADQP